jgi:hypothetical protein
MIQYYLNGIASSSPSITDWIQAFGTLIAIIAAIFSFTKLFRRDKEKDSQIGALTTLAENQTNINSTMTLQLKEQEKQTSILREFLELFLHSESEKSKSVEFQKALFELEQKKRKLDIRPMFSFSGGRSNGAELFWKLRNNGHRGFLKKINVRRSGNTSITSLDLDKMIESKSEYDLHARRTDGGRGSFLPNFEIEIFFSDVEGNLYCQVFDVSSREKIMSEPIEVTSLPE